MIYEIYETAFKLPFVVSLEPILVRKGNIRCTNASQNFEKLLARGHMPEILARRVTVDQAEGLCHRIT